MTNPTAGHPCWTEVTPYPFGADGNPVDPASSLCSAGDDGFAPDNFGAQWAGDFNVVQGDEPCYLEVESLAFRAWNRGLAATGPPSNTNFPFTGSTAFGVWLFNGEDWFPDPSFPGSAACPGSTVMWAGKLDYWLVGSSTSPQTTLCRFDGVNLDWEPLSLPAATLAKLPVNPATGKAASGVGITSGACYAWNNCSFFGTDGIEVHWDGQSLTDVSSGLGASPWLQGDFTNAIAGTDASGQPFGLAVTRSSFSSYTCPNFQPGGACPTTPQTFAAVSAAPDDSPAPQVFSSRGGPWAPASFAPPTSDTDLTLLSANTAGQVWVAGGPGLAGLTTSTPARVGPAPLESLTESGGQSCSGGTFTDSVVPSATSAGNIIPKSNLGSGGFQWYGLSTFPGDGSALAGAGYFGSGTWSADVGGAMVNEGSISEPLLVRAACGKSPTFTQFRRPDPLDSNQGAGAPLIPADANGWVTAVAANASNDAWAATSAGTWRALVNSGTGDVRGGQLAPQLYRWTDGQVPNAPAGNDDESRPSLFTLSPPVFQVVSPTVTVAPSTTKTTTTKKGAPKTVKLPPAIYAIRPPRIKHGPRGTFILSMTFKVRRPVTVELEASRGHKVVASSGFKHFTGHSGSLAIQITRRQWPTGLHLVSPQASKK